MKVTFVVLTIAVGMVNGKIFNNCELGSYLLKNFSYFYNKGNIDTWVCIAKYESTFNTAAVSPPNTDGSQDYGIFQINSRYWCGPGKGCGIPCSSLTDDDITDDVKCAKHIAKVQGLTAWTVYNTRCKDPAVAAETTKGCQF